MAALGHLRRTLAFTLHLSSRGDRFLAASLNPLSSRLLSTDTSDSSGGSASDSGDSDDDEHAAAGAPTPVVPPQAPVRRLSREDRLRNWDTAMQKEQGKARGPGRDRGPAPPEHEGPIFAGEPEAALQPEELQAEDTILGGFPISERFKNLITRYRDVSEADLCAEIDATLGSRQPRGRGAPRTQGSANDSKAPDSEDYLVLAEAIEAYLSVAPFPDPNIDGLTTTDHAMLSALGATLRHIYGTDGREQAMPAELAVESPLVQRVVNTAPPGRVPWECLGVDEERGVVHWAADFTAGRAREPWRNARISDAAKDFMYKLHTKDPQRYSAGALAKEFRLREQRVMAILALKEQEAAAKAEGKVPEGAEELRELMEDEIWGCREATGAGERHFVNLPSYPAYKELDTDKVMSRLEAVLGRPIDEISEEDLTPEVAQSVLGVKSAAQWEEDLAAKEERHLVEEFKAALDFNLGRSGQGISRDSRRTVALTRPEEGWSLVVTPLGKGVGEGPYVATPQGKRRELTGDEQLLVKRKTPKRRRRIL